MIRFSRTLGAVAGMILCTACGGGPSDTVPDQSVDEKEAEITADPGKPQASKKADRKHGKGRGGPAMLLGAALDQLTLRADQKQKIEALMGDLKTAGPGRSAEARALEKTIAQSVRVGSFDDAALAKHYSALENEAKRHAEKIQTALNELHRTLEPEQRTELVTALESRMKQGPREGKRHGRDFEKGPRFDKGPLRELGLSDAQRQKLDGVREQKPDFDRHGEWKARAGLMLTAFAKADFDGKKLVDPAEMARHAKSFAEMRVKRARTLTEILTPEQRTKYADSLETRSHGEKR